MKRLAWACSERWLRCVGAALACVLLLAAPARADDGAMTLTEGEFVLGDASAPPGDDAAWQRVALPDLWDDSRPGTLGYAWYRFRFSLPRQPDTPQAVFSTRMRTVAAIFVNGTQVGQTGLFGKPDELGASAQLFQIQPGLLKTGSNVLHVRLWVEPDHAGRLAKLQVGEWVALRQALDRERFKYDTTGEITFALALGMGAFGLSVWWRRRDQTMLGYFSLTALALACQIPVDSDWWPALSRHHVLAWQVMSTLRVAKFTFLVLYSLRFAGWCNPRVERLIGLAMVANLALLDLLVFEFDGVVDPAILYTVNYGTFALPGTAALVLILLSLRRAPLAETVPLLLAHVVSVAGSMAANINESTELLGGVQYLRLHMLPLLLVMGWIVSRRFGASLDAAERLNRELAGRIEAKRVELEANYRRVADLEAQQAVAVERARLMSDMHDGIGGQLISALGLVEAGAASHEQVAAALRECIDDLRLAIDSLEPADDDLLPVLGNLRYRLEPRLKARGIALEWQVGDLPRLECLTPGNVLQVLRILQEAFTNVLKHTHASVVHVATSTQAGGITIDVRDDGQGFDEHACAQGRGLANMRRRARTVGGDLTLTSSPAGTTLSLLLPTG